MDKYRKLIVAGLGLATVIFGVDLTALGDEAAEMSQMFIGVLTLLGVERVRNA